jgi:enterochelin esterase-like enzyme
MKKSLLERAEREQTPLIDGEKVTFVWKDNGVDKKAPQLQADFDSWRERTLTETAPGLWTFTTSLPSDAYVEYIYSIDGERVPDPFNPRQISNGMGKMNHYFAMPEALMTPLVKRKREIPAGTITKHTLEHSYFIAGGKRIVHVYQPPTDEPSPLIVVFDGNDYLRRARLPQIVDNLIAQKRIRPVALAMVEHGRLARFIEYACSDSTVTFVGEFVLPLAQSKLNLIEVKKTPGAYGVLGASMGGLISLYTAYRLPEIFGNVLCQSGAFALDVLGRPPIMFDLVKTHQPIKIWMDVGRFEYLLRSNREMHTLLQQSGYEVTYREYSAGHNYTAWRNDVEFGLQALFGK